MADEEVVEAMPPDELPFVCKQPWRHAVMDKVELNKKNMKDNKDSIFNQYNMVEAPPSIYPNTWVKQWGILVNEFDAGRLNKPHSSTPLRFICCASSGCMTLKEVR